MSSIIFLKFSQVLKRKNTLLPRLILLKHSCFRGEMNATAFISPTVQQNSHLHRALLQYEPKTCSSVARAVDIFPVTSMSGDVSTSLLQISAPDWLSETVCLSINTIAYQKTSRKKKDRRKKSKKAGLKRGCSSIWDILASGGMTECVKQKKWCNLVTNLREIFIMNMAPVRWSKPGYRKTTMCVTCSWTDENLVNLERNNCYKNEICTFSGLQHYSW